MAAPLSVPSSIAERPSAPIRYGGDAAFAPFESLDDQGRPTGFQVELMQVVGRRLGTEVQVRLAAWPQIEADFRAGALDVIAMVDTAERRAWARFARSHATPVFAVYRRPGDPEPPVLAELADRRVAVLAGPAMRDTLRAWLHPVQAAWQPWPDVVQALRAVAEGRADLALLPRAYADSHLAGSPAQRAVVAGSQDFHLQAYALAVAPGRDALAAQLQAALDAMERDGELEALRLRWLGSHRVQAEQQRLQQGLQAAQTRGWALGGAGVLGLSLLGVLLWRRSQRVSAEQALRVRAESELQRAEQLLAASFTRNPEPMLVVARDGGLVLDANEALLALLDVQDAELIGQPLARLEQHLDPGTLAGVAALFDAEGQLQAAPLRLRRRDGELRDCLLGVTPLQVHGGTQLLCMLRDVTEALRDDAALRRDFEATRQALQADADAQRQRADSAVDGRTQAEQALRDFTRAVSHDLRTPLNAVRGFAGLLRLHLQDGRIPQAIAASEQIEAAAQRMTAMIGALTRLAQTDRQPLQRTTVDMARLVGDTWAMLQAAHPDRRIDGRIDTLPTAQADADLVAQVWQNLLDNAWKFSREAADARIRVDSRVDGGRTWYRVADNGAGFDSAKAQRLFMPFQRFHGAARFGGTGIGLSLVRRIVEHHGGEVRLRSAEGVGTVVEFCLEPPAEGGTVAG